MTPRRLASMTLARAFRAAAFLSAILMSSAAIGQESQDSPQQTVNTQTTPGAGPETKADMKASPADDTGDSDSGSSTSRDAAEDQGEAIPWTDPNHPWSLFKFCYLAACAAASWFLVYQVYFKWMMNERKRVRPWPLDAFGRSMAAFYSLVLLSFAIWFAPGLSAVYKPKGEGLISGPIGRFLNNNLFWVLLLIANVIGYLILVRLIRHPAPRADRRPSGPA